MAQLLAVLFQHATCVTNSYAVEEAKRNIELKQFGSLEGLEQLLSHCTISDKITTQLPVSLAQKDIPILGGALASECSHLLTGDKRDFGAFFGKKVGNTIVLSPRQLVDLLRNKNIIK